MTADARSVGAAIRKRRQQLRLTQDELAERIGVHPSSVGNWESGKHLPERHEGAVEAALGISLRNLDGPVHALPARYRAMVEEVVDDPELRQIVIGLMEGTVTWPEESFARAQGRPRRRRPAG